MSKRHKTFQEFWPFYVLEHSKRGTRLLHFAGTTSLFILLTYALVTVSVISLIAGVIAAYGCAWSGHFLVEKNRPATFRYPLLSLIGDFKMYGLMLAGRMGKEVDRMKHQAI